MSGERITQTKLASKKFVETVIPEDCSVGVVTYAEDAERTCDFSLNVDFLQKTVDGVSTRSATNIESGLVEAEHQLTNMGGKRYIVLMTDGEANRGKTGDDLIAYANELKEQGISIYTLGFFQGGGGNGDAQRILEGIASDGHHYEVESVDDLEPFFNDMAEEINGTKFTFAKEEENPDALNHSEYFVQLGDDAYVIQNKGVSNGWFVSRSDESKAAFKTFIRSIVFE